mmetsp:Transcript_25750/g.35973  ORF Transcript_25750/g.35973 Transcript_25750/m.35973 type:complete len:131 (+) Transcript_25750:1170-1562(+)
MDTVLGALNQELDFSNRTFEEIENTNEGKRQKRHSASYQAWCVHRILELIHVLIHRDLGHDRGETTFDETTSTKIDEERNRNEKHAVASTTKKNKTIKQEIVHLNKIKARAMKLLREIWPTNPLTEAIKQ